MDPHFHHLTHSNIPASHSEALQIQELISLQRRNISILEEQIRVAIIQPRGLHSVDIDSTLLSQREEHYDQLRRYESTISTIRRVPAEILAEIFLLCCPESASLPPLCTDPRLVVTHICSRWRSLALGTQNLWNRVSWISSTYEDYRYTLVKNMSLLQQSEEEDKKMVGILEEWFRRAWCVPLEIKLKYPSSVYAPNWAIRDIVIPNSRRIQSLEMHVPEQTVHFFMRLSSIPFDSLESLHIFVTNGSLQVASWAGTDVPHSAPKLRCLGFDLQRGLGASLIAFPLSNLTFLHLRCHFVPACMSVLAECPMLIECELHISEDNDISEVLTWDSMITLPHLRLLHLETSMYESLFQYLCLPALEDLVVPLSENSDTFLALASRSGFTLTRLSVNSEPESLTSDGEDALETILRWTSSLSSLQLVGIPCLRVMKMIGCSQLVPNLQVFELICVRGGRGWTSRADMNGFIDMIDARKPSRREEACDDSSLREVVITQSPSKDLARFLPIENWRRDGMIIDVQHAPSKS